MDDLKPEFIAADPYKSRKWDELTAGSDIEPAAVPTLTLLVNWYAILDQCMRDISADDGTHVAYVNDQGDVKAMPQIATMNRPAPRYGRSTNNCSPTAATPRSSAATPRPCSATTRSNAPGAHAN